MTASFKGEGGEYHPGFLTPKMSKYNDDDCLALLPGCCCEERKTLTDTFKKIVDKLRVSPTGSHMALITFGSEAKSSFTFADRNYHNADTLKAKAKEAISYVPKHDGTRTDLAEDLAVKDVFTRSGGDRPSFEQRVKIIVAGIGSELSSADARENLEKVAGEDKDVTTYGNFEDLSDQLNNLTRKVCPPIDGQYTPWSKFSSCSKTCGEGFQTRTRTCTKPPPSKCGKDCIGADKETRSCTENPVIDGRYADWSESECNAKCGGGTLTRTRGCTHPPPNICGKACIGPAKETITCNEEECPRCPVDLAFVFDSSDTIGVRALEDAKMLVKKMVKGLELGADESRVALVVFADKVEVKARFSENLSVKQFKDMVQNMKSIGSRTLIDKALVETKLVFKEGRDDVYKIAVVLTDGMQSEDHDTKSLLSTSEPLRRAGVRVIAVAIGTRASKGRLRLMTDSMDDVKEEDEALEYFQ
ncbi:coadhesin-like [Pocillopora verrucosa]|uniref:coadhesin-like n=1 Tax=Pocillopora verrucosa TaxID=203993 RepID=UPI003340C17F